MAETKKRLTKQEKLAESRKKALALQRRLSASDERLADLVNKWEKDSTTKRMLGDKKSRINYAAEYNRLGDISDKAYKDYYNHMHKEFGASTINRAPVSFASRKYKKGFVDKQYVNDLYDYKMKKLGGKTA